MSRSKNFALPLAALLGVGVLLAGCERPPPETTQIGYRGLAMGTVENPRLAKARLELNQPPAVIAAVPEGGPLASSVYTNVKVLDDLSVAEFSRVMLAITEWVAPKDQACGYCHAGADMADDSKYQKIVSRRMLAMVRDINTNWGAHVGATGVTCYTCHRGNPVPAETWFKEAPPARAALMTGNRAGQNAPAAVVGLASLPVDPFAPYLLGNEPIRVASTQALPGPQQASSTQGTEASYSLMMHLSQALGVNCTFCHNTQSFGDWSGSTPQRVTAYHGIRMARALNVDYLEPLHPVFPAERLGPLGDSAKVNCATCHQGVNKPLYGAPMLKDYPALAGRREPPPAAETPAEGAAPADAAAATTPVTAAAMPAK